jgi:uncharacterized protein YbjT (DUF2867 family)
MSTKVIIVTGATGKQGGAFVNEFLASGATGHTLVAITRNPESKAAKHLEERGVKVVQADLNDVPALFAAVKKAVDGQPIWGVFSVQVGQARSYPFTA